jgi:hypothetical protein
LNVVLVAGRGKYHWSRNIRNQSIFLPGGPGDRNLVPFVIVYVRTLLYTSASVSSAARNATTSAFSSSETVAFLTLQVGVLEVNGGRLQGCTQLVNEGGMRAVPPLFACEGVDGRARFGWLEICRVREDAICEYERQKSSPQQGGKSRSNRSGTTTAAAW